MQIITTSSRVMGSQKASSKESPVDLEDDEGAHIRIVKNHRSCEDQNYRIFQRAFSYRAL